MAGRKTGIITKMNETDIKRKLWLAFNNFEYRLFNVYVFQFESDFLAVSKSGYVWEIEIKISKSDFKNDFIKATPGGKNKHERLDSDSITFKPNRFCFAVPDGLVSKKDVPDYAGLIYVPKNTDAKIIKHPKFLHKEKLLDNKYFLRQMLNKFYYRNIDLRKILDLREYDLKYKQRRLEFM
jgi:hypothetical protein